VSVHCVSVELTKARSHVDRILSNVPLLISSASISSYQLIQLTAISLYAVLHCRRRSASAAVSADTNGSQQNGHVDIDDISVSDNNSSQHSSYNQLVFTFTGGAVLVLICTVWFCFADVLSVPRR